MPLACLSAATVLSVFFSRPIIRDALGADTAVSGGMTKSAQKKSVAGADAPGAQAAARPLSRSVPRKASAVGAISASPRTHPPGRSRTPLSRFPLQRAAVPPLCHPCRRCPRLRSDCHPVAAGLKRPQWRGCSQSSFFGWRCVPACRGARTRLAIRRAVAPARSTIPREQPHRARRALATRWLSTAKYVRQRLGPPVPRHQFLVRTLHQRVHPCRGRPSDAIPFRLASCGNRRFVALEHACGQRRGRARPL